MTNNTDELLPCPFCGELPTWGKHSCEGACFLECTPCGVRKNTVFNKGKAIKAWNTRKALPDDRQDALEAVIEADHLTDGRTMEIDIIHSKTIRAALTSCKENTDTLTQDNDCVRQAALRQPQVDVKRKDIIAIARELIKRWDGGLAAGSATKEMESVIKAYMQQPDQSEAIRDLAGALSDLCRFNYIKEDSSIKRHEYWVRAAQALTKHADAIKKAGA